jgi:hypothetical protein
MALGVRTTFRGGCVVVKAEVSEMVSGISTPRKAETGMWLYSLRRSCGRDESRSLSMYRYC